MSQKDAALWAGTVLHVGPIDRRSGYNVSVCLRALRTVASGTAVWRVHGWDSEGNGALELNCIECRFGILCMVAMFPFPPPLRHLSL